MASTLHPPGCIPKNAASSIIVVAMRANALHAASRHYVQPLLNRQQTRTVLEAQSLLPWSRRQARGCPACCMLQTDTPGYSEDPLPPVRYAGVSLPKGRTKYTASIHSQGRNRYLGSYATPGEAACVYDEACIILKRDPVNFPRSQYDEAAILQFSDLQAFVKAKRTPRDTSSRYTGVYLTASGIYEAFSTTGNCYLGRYTDQAQAAMAYDHFCIYQGCAPTNFPDHPYDRQQICRPADLSEFVHQSRESSARETKLRQSSRYTGVSWDKRVNKWAAYVTEPTVGRKIHLGLFESEMEAARLVDTQRTKLGQETVNFPLKSRTTAVDKTWPGHLSKQAKT